MVHMYIILNNNSTVYSMMYQQKIHAYMYMCMYIYIYTQTVCDICTVYITTDNHLESKISAGQIRGTSIKLNTYSYGLPLGFLKVYMLDMFSVYVLSLIL